MPLGSDFISFAFFWTLALLFVKSIALFLTIPGIGGTNVPDPARVAIAFIFASLIASTGVRAPLPQHLAEGGLMIATEFLLGYLIGIIPMFIMSALAVAGQVTAGAIGLAQANLIDHTLGEPVSVIAKTQIMLGTCFFLLVDGHHVLIHALAGVPGGVALGAFRTDMHLAMFFLNRFEAAFQLAILLCAPILVTALVTQFVLGLITKSVPQVNIFVVSLPLTVGLGLYIIAYTFPGLRTNLMEQFLLIETHVSALLEPPLAEAGFPATTPTAGVGNPSRLLDF